MSHVSTLMQNINTHYVFVVTLTSCGPWWLSVGIHFYVEQVQIGRVHITRVAHVQEPRLHVQTGSGPAISPTVVINTDCVTIIS